MRIVFLLTQSLESPGGAGRVWPLAQALARAGHAVRILALHPDYRSLKTHRFTLDGIEVWYVAQMHVRKVGNEKYYFSPLALAWVLLVATLRLTIGALSSRADVIQVCKAQPMNLFAAWVKHHLHGTPVFLDSDDYETLNNRFGHPWQQKVVAWFERRAADFAAGISVTNLFLYQFYRSLGYPEGRLRVIPHGYDPRRFAILEQDDCARALRELRKQLNLPAGSRTVVFVGSISLLLHAVDLLLEAFQLVLRHEPAAVLIVVGGGEDFARVQEQARRLGVDGQVRFVGRVPRDQVPLYFRLGEVSVDPKRQGELEQTASPLKIVESMAAGTPCVSAAIGDSAAVLGPAGVMIEPGDPRALAEGILRVLQDETLRQTLRAEAHRRKSDFSWDRLAERMLELYSVKDAAG